MKIFKKILIVLTCLALVLSIGVGASIENENTAVCGIFDEDVVAM